MDIIQTIQDYASAFFDTLRSGVNDVDLLSFTISTVLAISIAVVFLLAMLLLRPWINWKPSLSVFLSIGMAVIFIIGMFLPSQAQIPFYIFGALINMMIIPFMDRWNNKYVAFNHIKLLRYQKIQQEKESSNAKPSATHMDERTLEETKTG